MGLLKTLMTHSVMWRSYGVAYWHKRFPDWPLKIRRCAPLSALLLVCMLLPAGGVVQWCLYCTHCM